MSNYNKPIRIAFIGGAINSAVGYAHFTACTLDKNYVLVAGCFSRNKEINKQTADFYKLPAEKKYDDYESMLENEKGNIDAVAILTPTPTHAEIIKKVLSKNIFVICEKALATSVEEAEDICKSIQSNSGFIAITYNYTGYPMVRELREIINKGALGLLQQIHIEMPQEGFLRTNNGIKATPQSWRLCDNFIPTVSLDLGVHIHHLVEFLGAGHALEVTADQRSYGLFEKIIDDVSCIALYPNNVRVNYWYGKTAIGYRNGLRVRVFGSLASAEWVQENPESIIFNHRDGRIERIDRGSPNLTIANEPRYMRFKAGHPSGFIEAFANIYKDIAEKIRNKDKKNNYVFDHEVGIRGMKFFHTLHQSAKLKSWQSFNQV